MGQLVVTPEVVASKINNMKENKSPGVDGISPKILKETVEQISTPLAHVFNMSLQEGSVPLEWKEANIIPLFKKGSINKSVNYRPVGLTSVICKLLETIIRDHMMDFLFKHKLINPSQHGFLKVKSCLTNMLCFFEEITKWVDANNFNKYFTTVGNTLAANLPQTGNDPIELIESNPDNFFCVPATPAEINNIILHSKSKKSTGFDNIDSYIVKQIAPQIVNQLADIFNKSFLTGIVPTVKCLIAVQCGIIV